MNSTQSMTSLPMRPSRKPRIILIVLIALCGLFVYGYTSRLIEKAQVEAEIALMQARIEEAKTEQHQLFAERARLNQPDYIDQVAREDFGFAKPGDTVLVVVKGPASSQVAKKDSASAMAVTPGDIHNRPIWRQWVVFFATEAFTFSVPD